MDVYQLEMRVAVEGMKTIGVKLSDEQAEAIQVAAARKGLTVSAAPWVLLRQATADFTDFSALDSAQPRKRGRGSKPHSAEELSQLFANGETLAELLDRFERPRRRQRG